MQEIINQARKLLVKEGKIFKSKTWQGGEDHPLFMELTHIQPRFDMLEEGSELEEVADQPWGTIHFEERIVGLPLNPPPSHKLWRIKTEDYMNDEKKFSHSYPERMWPKTTSMAGIRFEIGDLKTLVSIIAKDPTTRQAVMPMYSHEDLSASLLGQRVPCSLSWHFMLRDGKLDCSYSIRSCDALRHFHNDVYFANKLTNWIIKQSGIEAVPGKLIMTISSFHSFVTDLPILRMS